MIRRAKNLVRAVIITNPAAYRAVSEAKAASRHYLRLRLKDASETRRITSHYKDKVHPSSIKRQPTTKIAVVLHLYYTESWWMFKAALKNLHQPYDLFISLPDHQLEFADKVRADYKHAYIFESPNRGRDVLPFMQIASKLESMGYEYVLKMHSKKSPQRKDGSKWFKQLVSNLLPAKPEVMAKLIKTLDQPNTGIIGPKGQYISLMVNFPANGPRIAEALSNIYYPKLTDKVIRSRRQYGFFAGTMFWARLDALRPVLARDFKVNRFDPERGQIDATFAHALERVFCLVCEIEKRDLYEVSTRGLKKMDYKTDNIPDWSAVYIGPKPERKRRKQTKKR